MEYQKLETNFGTVIIKDALETELESLIEIYKQVFLKHNIFQLSDEEILQYLKEAHLKNTEVGGGFLVAVSNSKIIAGLLIKKEAEDLEGNHIVWKYNHIAISPGYEKRGIGTALLNVADEKIKSLIKENKFATAKIELGVSENEKDSLEFYKKCGFEIEGELKSHYRFNELVYILGKEL